MSEVKRAKLISFDSQRTNAINVERTVRICLVLPESTEDNCPEYNYKDELVAAKKKSLSETKKTNGLDPFNEEDDDVKRIAAEMEAKYGIGNPKKRKRRKDDYADIGMGYDESDSFIDNTDGYDEIVPKCVSTILGGFYINCGALEFKTEENVSSNDTSSSSSEDEENEDKSSLVKKLESSAESADEQDADVAVTAAETNNVEKNPNLVVNTNGMQKAIKKRLFSQDKIKHFKKNRSEEMKKTVRELLKEKRDDTIVPLPLDNGLPKKDSSTSPKDVKKANFTTTVENVIEAVVSKSIIKKPEMEEPSKSVEPKEVISNKPDDDKIVEIVLLPQNLPADITKIIEEIKAAAASCTEGKVKFFNDHVNTMLFNLEGKCKCLGKQSRMKVYEHLAPFVKCRKETLIKRAKNVCVIEEQKKLKVYLDRLRIEVTKIMPELIKNYEQESSIILQKRFMMQSDEANKSLRLPKRSFAWSEETKKLLRDVMVLKRKCFILEGKKDSLETHLMDFIKIEVLIIWPEGWMSVNNILRNCSLTFEKRKATSPIAKQNSNSEITLTSNASKPSNILTPSASKPSNILSPSASKPSNILTSSSNKPNILSSIASKPPNILTSSSSKPNILSSSASKPSNILTSSTSKPNILTSSAIKSSSIITPSANKPSSIIAPSASKPSNIINNSSALTITPVTSTSLKVSPEPKVPDETTIRTLPVMDIVKTSPPSFSNIKNSLPAANNRQKSSDVILIDESPIKHEDPKNLFQVIDLTDPAHKKVYLKKSKFYGKEAAKEEITGSSALTQIITDSLNDHSRYKPVTIDDSISKKLSTNPIDYARVKQKSEGDDIQKVMEDLKHLQKMSSPIKTELSSGSLPVSVIAFNKSFSQDAVVSTQPSKSTNSFQDAFQKHFIPDFIKASQSASSSASSPLSKTTFHNFNSAHKHNNSAKSSLSSNDRHFQTTNNNYAQQNCNSKLKTNCSVQQSGSHNLLNDMLTNFLSEYGLSRPTDNSKPTSQHK